MLDLSSLRTIACNGVATQIVRGGWPAATIALLGLALLAVPAGQDLEQQIGLRWLYALRGERKPPKDVSLIALNARAATALGLTANHKDWPRRMHAELVAYLSRAGARLVVIDLLFASPRDEADDRLLANEIAKAGNVVLAAQLERDTEPLRHVSRRLVRESFVEPIPL